MQIRKVDPHCDMFSVEEACPECGNEENETPCTCSTCGCMWEVDEYSNKHILTHGKLRGRLN